MFHNAHPCLYELVWGILYEWIINFFTKNEKHLHAKHLAEVLKKWGSRQVPPTPHKHKSNKQHISANTKCKSNPASAITKETSLLILLAEAGDRIQNPVHAHRCHISVIVFIKVIALAPASVCFSTAATYLSS